MTMRMLIIRPGAVGDTLLAFPVIHALRMRYDRCHITFVSNPAVLPLALEYGIADEVFDYGAAQWSELFLTTGPRALQGLLQRTDLAICWLRDIDGIVRRNLHTAGIKEIIIAPGRPAPDEHIHITHYLARTVGIENGVDTHWTFPNHMQQTVSPIFPHANDAPRSVAIHPGSGGAYKCWPISHFVATITKLWQHNLPILLLAGPADHERLTTLLELLPSPEMRACEPRPYTERLTTPATLLKTLVDAPLLEVAQHLRLCQAYLGNDSGITHLAGMLGIPTVALFGPSDPLVWQPIGPRVMVLAPLENLDSDGVLSAVICAINREGDKSDGRDKSGGRDKAGDAVNRRTR